MWSKDHNRHADLHKKNRSVKLFKDSDEHIWVKKL